MEKTRFPHVLRSKCYGTPILVAFFIPYLRKFEFVFPCLATRPAHIYRIKNLRREGNFLFTTFDVSFTFFTLTEVERIFAMETPKCLLCLKFFTSFHKFAFVTIKKYLFFLNPTRPNVIDLIFIQFTPRFKIGPLKNEMEGVNQRVFRAEFYLRKQTFI